MVKQNSEICGPSPRLVDENNIEYQHLSKLHSNQFTTDDLLSLNLPLQDDTDDMLLESEYKNKVPNQNLTDSSSLPESDLIEEIKRDSIRLSKEVGINDKYDSTKSPFEM